MSLEEDPLDNKICEKCSKPAEFISNDNHFCYRHAEEAGWFEGERNYKPINMCLRMKMKEARITAKKERKFNYRKVISFSKESDEWKTPPSFIKFINKHFKISVDPCCSVFNVRAKKHYTIKDNGLKKKWESWAFVNPPYSQARAWLEKSYKEYQRGIKVLVLIFAKTETLFFQQYAFKANYILFIKGRLKFQGLKRSKRDVAPFGSSLIIFGKINRYQHKALRKLGVLIKLK